jgi:UDP-glucose:(heptosyl)LPS alpha-1,3-glucosyltransferase
LTFAILIFKYFPFGGVQRDMLRIAKDLIALGHKVTIYTGEWCGDLPHNIPVKVLPVRGILNHQRYQYLINQMQSALKNQAFDLVIGFNRMPQLDVYFAADPCFVARAKKDKSWWYRLTARYRFFAASEYAVMRADGDCKILLIEPNEKKQFQAFYQTPEARFHLLSPNIPKYFLDVSQAQARRKIRHLFALPTHATLLLSVCTNFLLKGVDRSIVALASLPDHMRIKTWLLVIGGDKVGAMKKVAKKYGVEKQVIFTGSREDVPMLMHAADVMMHPARSELAGLVIMEAMVSGLPQIVTDHCGYAFHVKAANAGIVLDSPFNQEVLNRSLAQMLSDASRQKIAASAIRYTELLKAQQSGAEEATYVVNLARIKNRTKK